VALPPIDGVMSRALRGSKLRGAWPAIVVDNKDGEGNPGYRVKLKFPWLNEQDATYWARIATPMGGSDRGTYVLPEIDDQVLAVFEHGDINRPIVIGALWSKKQEPVEVNQSGKNNTKLIKSRTGHRIIFDDKDGAEKIIIVDSTKKNKVVLDAVNKILKIESDGDVAVIAKTNVILHSNALKIGTTEGVTGKAASLLTHSAKTFGFKATSGITIGGGNTTINTSNAAATSVSGSGAGELGGAAAAQAADQVQENKRGAKTGGRSTPPSNPPGSPSGASPPGNPSPSGSLADPPSGHPPPDDTGDLTVTVTDQDGALIAEAGVEVDGPTGQSARTDAAGQVSLSGLRTGTYTITASKAGFASASTTVTVAANTSSAASLVLPKQLDNHGDLVVTVTSPGGPVSDATVRIEGAIVQEGQTGSDGTARFPGIPAGDYQLRAIKDGFSPGSTSTTTAPAQTTTAPVTMTLIVKITAQTVATSPPNRARTRIGVGEEVELTVSPAPANWSITSGAGTLTPSGSQTKVIFTASDKAETVVITASLPGGSGTINFTIVEPSDWTMKRQSGTNLRHKTGRPDCGWKGVMYVHPNDVNFYRIETREKDSKYVGTGSYAGYNGTYHGSYPPPDRASGWFVITAHSETDGSTDNAPDEVYTGDPGPGVTGAAPPFTVGSGHFPITIQWRVVGKTSIHDFSVTNQEDEIFSTGRCESRKGAHTESTNHDDPTSTY
jgi:phage baseplate assembly protein gpV